MKISKSEIEAIIEASLRTFVPFHQLVLSQDHQARPAGSTPRMSIEELAASIKECGILQNLIVVKGARSSYEVCAGGRRLQALTLLVAAGALPENFPVPVLVVPADRALIASLSENAFHVPMHPADEFEAFGKLLARGKSAEDVAAAFGVSPLVVRRRMRLAAVSPKLIAQFRQDKITLECLMVLASVEDHERQEQAWAGLDTWSRHPDQLRRLLNRGDIESDRNPVARYVTVRAYEKAGGPTRRDLFSQDEKKVYLLDALLLDQLAVAKLQRKAKRVAAEGWKWVDVRPRLIHEEYARHGELRKSHREPDAAEALSLAGLQAQLAERRRLLSELEQAQEYEDEDEDEDEHAGLFAERGAGADEDADEDAEPDSEHGVDDATAEQVGEAAGEREEGQNCGRCVESGDGGEGGEGGEGSDGSDEDTYAQLHAECDELAGRIATLQESLSVWPADLMALAGCVVYVGNDAVPTVRYGLIRPEDRSEMAAAVQVARHGLDGGAGNEGRDGAEGSLIGDHGVSLPTAKVRPVHSERLTRNLTAHRVAAIQAELLARPDIAMAALTAQLAGKLLLDGYQHLNSSGNPLTVSATDTHGVLSNDADDIACSTAWRAVEAQRQAWRERLPAEVDALLP